jgi:hypothetical protein
MSTNRSRQRGGGLIDVMVAMGVLSGAVAGLARLQAVAFRETSEARMRSVATMLARAKLDDLRTYSQVAPGAPGVFGFDEISNDRGGSEDAEGRLRIAAGPVLIDDIRFERSWSAAPRYFCSEDAPLTGLPCTSGPAPSRPSLMALTVVIAWDDRDGRSQRVELDGTAAALDPLAGVVSSLSAAAAPASPPP